jgi:hypothetical protein
LDEIIESTFYTLFFDLISLEKLENSWKFFWFSEFFVTQLSFGFRDTVENYKFEISVRESKFRDWLPKNSQTFLSQNCHSTLTFKPL